MRFRFPLEVLLKQRSREEEMSRKNYLSAQSKVDDSLVKIEDMWGEIRLSREKMAKVQHSGGNKFELLASLDEFMNGNKIRIEREKVNLRKLIMVADEKHELLVEAAKEHKILIRLKEKKFEKFKKERKKKELKENDDIVTMRHKRSV